MPADGRPQSGDPLGEIDPGLVVARIVADVDNRLDARCPSLLQSDFRIERCFQVQKMRV